MFERDKSNTEVDKQKPVRSSHPDVFCKKGVLRNFAKFTRRPVPESLAQVFSCEFCGISMNTFSYRTPPVASSDLCKNGKTISMNNIG